MNDDLYFIPIIIEAFKQPDRSNAIKKAFEQIEQLGKLDRYSQGWRQFCLFMNETLVSAENYSTDQLQAKLANAFKRPEVFDVTIENELAGGERTIAENESFLALCPSASMCPFEVYVLPRVSLLFIA